MGTPIRRGTPTHPAAQRAVALCASNPRYSIVSHPAPLLYAARKAGGLVHEPNGLRSNVTLTALRIAHSVKFKLKKATAIFIYSKHF